MIPGRLRSMAASVIIWTHAALLAAFGLAMWISSFAAAATERREPPPIAKSERRIAEQIKTFPETASCLLVSDLLPWEIAYLTAPRKLYRFKGDPTEARAFIDAYDITCVVVFLGRDTDGVYAPEDFAR
ncbi:MAG: hypothetical protein M5R36_04475 [Deltaproteobacteria bacterium]|nr:hypothetical protein [Deltaproteobacteria bacterium]